MRIFAVVLMIFMVAACSQDAPAPGAPQSGAPHDVNALLGGKEDNYVSTNAREFVLSGQAHFALPEGFEALDAEAQAARLDSLAQARMSAVTRGVRGYVDEVIREANGGITGEDAKYFTYLRRDASELESVEVTQDGQGRLRFSIELVGSVYLMSKVAPEQGAARRFTVSVTDWGSSQAEAVEVTIEGSPSQDAFPRYDELFADGIYDIGLHFGGDYNEGRFDIETARWTVDYLLSQGWDNKEVASFDDLGIDSPPFTRAFVVEGRPVEARIHIYHSDMVQPDQEERLSQVMRLSLAERDVVIYSGHAGENAGFILDYQPRHEIRASDFKELPLADKYQIYVFDGCRTYRTYVDDLLENEHKSFDNVDIVTTVNTTPFSAGYQLIHQFLYWLTLSDEQGRHFPVSWKAMLRGLNTEQFSSVHYGVHGVDNDPKLNPHASEGIACKPCQRDADCGAGGNFCLGYGDGAACGVACTQDSACGEGMRCARLWEDPELFYLPKQCVPRDLSCQ